MNIRDDILEYPYNGRITRETIINGDEQEVVCYDGVMDLHMVTNEEGRTLQVAAYIVSIPLLTDDNGEYIVPKKYDKVAVTRYGEEIELVVDNATPSQLGGVSIYATRKIW